jgi:Uri superfamily endonuclease
MIFIDDREFFISEKPSKIEDFQDVTLYRVNLLTVIKIDELWKKFETTEIEAVKEEVIRQFLGLTTNLKEFDKHSIADLSELFKEAYSFNFPKIIERNSNGAVSSLETEKSIYTRILRIAETMASVYNYTIDYILHNVNLVQALCLQKKLEARQASVHLHQLYANSQSGEARQEYQTELIGLINGYVISKTSVEEALREAKNNPDIAGKTLSEYLANRQKKMMEEANGRGE